MTVKQFLTNKKSKKTTTKSPFVWQILDSSKSRQVGVIDPGPSPDPIKHVLAYIASAQTIHTQNVVPIQYKSNVYFRVFRPVEPDGELLAFYGDKYTASIGIDPKNFLIEKKGEDRVRESDQLLAQDKTGSTQLPIPVSFNGKRKSSDDEPNGTKSKLTKIQEFLAESESDDGDSVEAVAGSKTLSDRTSDVLGNKNNIASTNVPSRNITDDTITHTNINIIIPNHIVTTINNKEIITCDAKIDHTTIKNNDVSKKKTTNKTNNDISRNPTSTTTSNNTNSINDKSKTVAIIKNNTSNNNTINNTATSKFNSATIIYNNKISNKNNAMANSNNSTSNNNNTSTGTVNSGNTSNSNNTSINNFESNKKNRSKNMLSANVDNELHYKKKMDEVRDVQIFQLRNMTLRKDNNVGADNVSKGPDDLANCKNVKKPVEKTQLDQHKTTSIVEMY